MAEYKQYINQSQENGTVQISEDVVSTIVEHAISDVEGVAGVCAKPGADIADLIGKKNWGKALKILIAEDNTLTIECNINILFGQSVVDVANNTQNAVVAAVESMTGVSVKAVNINVCGIVRQ